MTDTQSLEWVEHFKALYWLFLILFALLVEGERKAPRRPYRTPKMLRWPYNLALAFLDFLTLRLLFPGAALFASYEAVNYHFGLFNWLELPLAFSIFWTILILDIAVYYQHRFFHAQPQLWKIHRVHHADLDVDITTAARVHPMEALLSWAIKSAVILPLGLPVMGVFLFESALFACLLWNHSNLRLPSFLEKITRTFIVTPDLHRIHHSAITAEANSNFGFIFSFWDRLFGTYRAEPQKGQLEMRVGLDLFNDPKYLRGDQMLLMPFMDKEGRAALGNFTKVE